MKRRKESKKTLILFIVLYLLLACAISTVGFLCYLSFDLNQGMKLNRDEIKAENMMLSDKVVDLKTKVTELEDQIAEKQALTEQQAAEENAMIQPPSSESLFENEVSIDEMTIGQIIDEIEVIGSEDSYFKSYEIIEGDSVYNRINGRSYYENPNIGLGDLRYLKMIHYNFDHQVQVGEMIVNAAIAEDVINLFKDLFYIEYEVQSMKLIDDYWTGDGDSSDSNSIDHNNTSAFCYREITGGGSLSNHAFGRAIDINPQQNPYVWFSNGTPQWSHENASAYIDRSNSDPHVINEGDECYNLFAKYGFSWGGLWEGTKDYQHFEKEW
ncbi:MAG: M15 family metallopeptidase [Blautia wexlerae]